MMRIILTTFIALVLSSTNSEAQDRVQHPISTARIAGLDGKTQLTFEEPITVSCMISVIDLTGKVMFTINHEASNENCYSIEIPIENLRKGIYMLQVVSSDDKTKTLKLQRN